MFPACKILSKITLYTILNDEKCVKGRHLFKFTRIRFYSHLLLEESAGASRLNHCYLQFLKELSFCHKL